MTSSAPLRVGLVGLGGVAQEHLRGYVGSSRVKVVAGADIDEQRCQAASETYGITPYADFRAMFSQEDLDIVAVLTPPAVHRVVVEEAAAKGFHILCEKPLAPSWEDAQAIAQAVDDAGVSFHFGASYRHLPAMQAARQLILSEKLGEIRLAYEVAVGGHGAQHAKPLPASHYPEGGFGGTPMGLVDHGVHMIDAFPWMTGLSVSEVYGRGNKTGSPLKSEYTAMTLSNGAIVHLVYDEATFGMLLPGEGMFTEGAGWNIHGYIPPGGFDSFPTTLTVHGSEGALRIYPYANKLFVSTEEGLNEYRLPPLPRPNHFCAQIDSLAEAITEGRAMVSTLEDGVRSTSVLLAIYESAVEGKAISIPASA